MLYEISKYSFLIGFSLALTVTAVFAFLAFFDPNPPAKLENILSITLGTMLGISGLLLLVSILTIMWDAAL